MKKHTVIIMPSDFKGTNYLSNSDCPLARAVKRHFKTNNLCIGSTMCIIDGKRGAIKGGFDDDDFEFVKAFKEPYPVVITI